MAILKGILTGIGLVAVVVVGILYDQAQYEERQRQRNRKKND